MKHQSASIHELARLELLAGLPGEILAELAERMERRLMASGESCDVRGQLVAVVNGLAHANDASGQREAVEPGGVVPEASVSLRALTPVTVVRCPRSVLEEVVGAPPTPA